VRGSVGETSFRGFRSGSFHPRLRLLAACLAGSHPYFVSELNEFGTEGLTDDARAEDSDFHVRKTTPVAIEALVFQCSVGETLCERCDLNEELRC
jgi:hypothetical protein